MKAVANTILATLLISIFMLTFTNFLMLFPWYLTLVYETMNLSTDVATVNGITKDMVDNVENDLKDKPLFKRKMSDLKIYVSNEDNTSDKEVGIDSVFPDDGKPLYVRQRGKKIKVAIEAVFPFDLKIFGITYSYEQKITFDLTTTGVRYYKDIDDPTIPNFTDETQSSDTLPDETDKTIDSSVDGTDQSTDSSTDDTDQTDDTAPEGE